VVKRLLLAMLATGIVTCSFDPVHDEAIVDLGPETPGIGPGPLHRAGQPCLVCHDGSAATPVMSVGGTVYGVPPHATPVAGAIVALADSSGSTFTATTNAAGNFYVEQASWQPFYPLQVSVVLGEVTAPMSTIIGRDGSCATCHTDPPSRISAGRVSVAAP
jgi:hypothetical protein